MAHADQLRQSLDSARTHLADLQAEMEAGARHVERIHADATSRDPRVETFLRQTARHHTLSEHVGELKASIKQQRALLRDLRASLDRVRQSVRALRGTPTRVTPPSAHGRTTRS
jgi:hypothetical protein